MSFGEFLILSALCGFVWWILLDKIPRGKTFRKNLSYNSSQVQNGYDGKRINNPLHAPILDDPKDYDAQLAILDQVYEKCMSGYPILEEGEGNVYRGARKALWDLKDVLNLNGWQIHAQASMGEFIETSFDKARKTYNSKRVDILICDENFMPKLVIEHQGKNHISKLPNASGEMSDSQADIKRNQVKQKTLDKAGIPWRETPKGIGVEESREMIKGWLQEIIQNEAAEQRKPYRQYP